MKLYAYITMIENYVNGSRDCLTLRDTNKHAPDYWVYVGPVEVPLGKISEESARYMALDRVEEELRVARDAYTEDMQSIQNRKEKLLAITHKPDEVI